MPTSKTAQRLEAEAEALWDAVRNTHLIDNPTPHEATAAAKKLYRFAMGETFKGDIVLTSGQNASYLTSRTSPRDSNASPGELRVNPSRGWGTLVEHLAWSLGHHLHSGSHRGAAVQVAVARLWLRMLKEAMKRGWFVGSLKPKPKEIVVPSKDAVRAAKIARLEAREAAWEKKAARAETALKKIRRSLNTLRRHQT